MCRSQFWMLLLFTGIFPLWQLVASFKLPEKIKMGEEPSPKEVARMREGAKKIRFLLRDRSKSNWFPILQNDPIPENIWIKGGDLKLIIHGYTFKVWLTLDEKMEEQNIWRLGLAYANYNSSINVIIVDWTNLSTEKLPRYFQAAHATKFVGRAVAEFLVRLVNESYIASWDSIHIIGFSLGGHTVGSVGKGVQDIAGAKIGRITGLDPAGPFFDVYGKMPEDVSGYLEKTDAKYVDIIHCNMRLPGYSVIGHFGTCVESGHSDFYPDGGESQSVCTEAEDKSATPCSHMRCPELMAQSLTKPLLGCPCTDWISFQEGKCNCTLLTGGVLMGDPLDISRASGRYYLSIT